MNSHEPYINCRNSSLRVIPTVAPLKIRKVRRSNSETEESRCSTPDTPETSTTVSSTRPSLDVETNRQIFLSIYEIYSTECQYARDMACIVQIYLAKSSASGLSIKQLTVLFASINDVLNISLAFLAFLENMVPMPILAGWKHTSDKPSLTCVTFIGEAMLRVLEPETYGVYEHYIQNHPKQMRLCRNLTRDTKTRVGRWLYESNERAREHTSAASLEVLLSEPVHRLSKYLLYMRAILAMIPSDHADFQSVLKAHNRVTHYIECINKRV